MLCINHDEDGIDVDQSDIKSESDKNNDQCLQARSNSNYLPAVPPWKHRCLDVPYCTQHKLKQQEQMLEWSKALITIDKLLSLKKIKFISGPQGLQACHTLAIQSHLQIFMKNQQYLIDASECAAESHGFAAKCGGQLLWGWTQHWTESHQLSSLVAS